MATSMIVKPDLPQTIVRWVGQSTTRIPPTTNQIVAVPIVHDWGPRLEDSADPATGRPGGLELYTSLAEWEAVYGTGDTPGHDAVVNALLGMGVPGGGGAGGVYTPRMHTAGSAPATLTRANTGAGANALVLTARYHGVRGNLLSAIVEDDPVDITRDRLRILFNGAVVESYTYAQTDIAALAASINARSRWVTAVSNVTGTALSFTAGTAFAGGSDGSVLTAVEWANAQAALEFKNFGIMAPFNLTDATIKTQLVTWMKGLADQMRPFRMVTGGAAGETVDAAIAELTAALRDEHHVRFGVGTYHDDLLGKDYSTAQLAPRIAGVLAARGRRSALTSALLGGLHVVGATGPDSADLIVGRDQGVTMLKRVSHPDAEVAVSQGVTTFTSRTTVGKPYEFFSEPRIVGVLDGVLRRITEWGDDIVIGDLTVTDDTRREVSKEVTKILNELEEEGTAQLGTSFVNVINTDADPQLSDSIPFQFGFKPARTANYLIGEGRIS